MSPELVGLALMLAALLAALWVSLRPREPYRMGWMEEPPRTPRPPYPHEATEALETKARLERLTRPVDPSNGPRVH